MNIYCYQIDLKATHKPTGQSKLLTRVEHAYSIGDAIQQAIFNALSEHGWHDGSHEVTLVKVGPPEEKIQASASGEESSRAVLAALKKFAQAMDKGEAK